MQDIFTNWWEQLVILFKVAYAMILGGVIGFNRERDDKPAGIKTQMLVAGAGALLVLLADVLMLHYKNPIYENIVRGDPIRLVTTIITGISFIGAGTIIKNQSDDNVEGLTTAASLLFSMVIGIAVGVNQYILAAGATAYAMFVLIGLKKLEKWVLVKKKKEEILKKPPEE